MRRKMNRAAELLLDSCMKVKKPDELGFSPVPILARLQASLWRRTAPFHSAAAPRGRHWPQGERQRERSKVESDA